MTLIALFQRWAWSINFVTQRSIMTLRYLRSVILLSPIVMAAAAIGAPTCPLSYGSTDAAKSNKLYLYFPAASDNTFPNYTSGASPAAPFDVADLDPAIGTTAQLRDRIFDVVSDDYCEFNVQVLSTTVNPATIPGAPLRRVTVAVGSDNPNGAWGQAQEVDIGDAIDTDFARVWAGTYVTCEGAAPGGAGGCSMTGSLQGANSTLDRWAQAIGGTAAHEAGHTYGLAHTDDDPPGDLGGQPGPAPLPGEDSFHRHLMPAGYNLTGDDRASYRRHMSDRAYGLLATNVGLSIQTMHNWDLTNPNAGAATSLAIDFLSPLPSITVSWSYSGASSPWINPTVAGPLGTAVFKGNLYNRYRITWSTGNPAWAPTPGIVPGGGHFHIGATFTGVDFNQPDPIIIQDTTLFNASSNPLTLHPRLPMYDTGTVDSAGNFAVNFFAPDNAELLRMLDSVVYQLPRPASIDSMIGHGKPFAFDGLPIAPWSRSSCNCDSDKSQELLRCSIASTSANPHVSVSHHLGEIGVVDCRNGVPPIRRIDNTGGAHRDGGISDSPNVPDFEGPLCAGTTTDPFPSTAVYIVATFVDPEVRHYDPVAKKYVVGPVASRLYYQFAGVRHLSELADPCPNHRC
jgi:hypothetical protein